MAEAVRHVLAGPVEAGEDLGADPGLGGHYGGYAGIPSGYEDTLTDSGGRRRRRPAAAEGGYAAAEGGYAAAGGAAGTAAYADGTAVYADGLYGDAGLEGRYGRDAAFGESAASGFAAGYGHGDYDEYESEYPGSYSPAGSLEQTAHLDPMPGAIPGTVPGVLPPDATRVYDQRTTPMNDSGGRGGQPADFPDGTRVYDLPSAMADSGGGRHAGPPTHHGATEPPVRRRAAETHHGTSPGFGGRRGGLRPDVRRKALITAAVAVPALLGLSVALAVSSSGKSPDGGAPGSGPAQQTDAPSAGTGTDDLVPPTEPLPTSTSLYGHSSPHRTYTTYPTNGHLSGGSSSTADPTSTGRSGQPTGTGSSGASSQPGQPTSGNSTSQGSATPPSSASSHPSSGPS